MVTTLKNTAKPVTEVQFPAITICSSGFHMSNVEKKIEEDFAKWRLENKRIEKSKEATRKDVEDYMFLTFQITTEDKETEPANILDILDTMISPDADASVAANGLRENAIACAEETQTNIQSIVRKKREDNCDYSCPNSSFSMHGSKCFIGVFSSFPGNKMIEMLINFQLFPS